jgi:predicted nuclease of predicted toxin-antitoxin system
VRFIVDAQLPPALARWLTEQGHESTHAIDQGLEVAPDKTIWEVAAQTSAIVITKDEDFAQRRSRVDDGPIVVWVRLGNTRRQPLIRWFEQLLPDVLVAIDDGETLVEIR